MYGEVAQRRSAFLERSALHHIDWSCCRSLHGGRFTKHAMHDIVRYVIRDIVFLANGVIEFVIGGNLIVYYFQ